MRWTGLCPRFSQGEEAPRPVAPFGRRFRDDDEPQLAHVVAEQCRKRRLRAWDLRESIHESLFRQVLFPDADRH